MTVEVLDLNETPLRRPPRWWPVFVGLAVLYLPTLLRLADGLWLQEEHAYGYLILAGLIWTFWSRRSTLAVAPTKPSMVPGSISLALGLLVYVIGRSQNIAVLEVGSMMPVLLGVMLIMQGTQLVRAAWFSLLFMFFLIPLPGSVVDAMTGPLKEFVSRTIEHVLYLGGYPIARSGVTLMVGQYQLLVADACSGLRSIFSLSALGLIYLFAMGYRSRWRNAILAASIIPIAISANLLRVLVLVLITYHFGDAAGQGFLHGLAGMLLLVASLIFLFFLDGLIGLFDRPSKLAGVPL